MDEEILESQIVDHFPDPVFKGFETPFLKLIRDFKIYKNRPIGAVSNHKIASVSVYKFDKKGISRSPRKPSVLRAYGVHEFIHNLYNQKRYDTEGLTEVSVKLNESYNRRKKLLPDLNSNWCQNFGETAAIYGSLGPSYPFEFSFKPRTKDLERSVRLTLAEDEVLDILEAYQELEQKESEMPNNELKKTEKEMERRIDEVCRTVDEEKVDQYIQPIKEIEAQLDEDRRRNGRARDEAMARFYVSTTIPEYAQCKFDEARNSAKNVIGELNHDNSDFSRQYIAALNEEYNKKCASEFYHLTERYRELRSNGYSKKDAADRLLVQFLEDVEPLS